MAGERYLTTDHDRIREWVEARGGWPSTVASTYRPDDAGLIRLDFPGYKGDGDSLKRISWDEWFAKFDENDYVLLYQETLASGEQSNFNRILSRETAEGTTGAEWQGERRAAGRGRKAA
ncbi:MAG TPA: hypothetical protein VNZ57_00425 [Longimicrobiales bacterium]|nr:hypothetical protein [Longimicrobiales bacterium]